MLGLFAWLAARREFYANALKDTCMDVSSRQNLLRE
jgi:hypothetical protein